MAIMRPHCEGPTTTRDRHPEVRRMGLEDHRAARRREPGSAGVLARLQGSAIHAAGGNKHGLAAGRTGLRAIRDAGGFKVEFINWTA